MPGMDESGRGMGEQAGGNMSRRGVRLSTTVSASRPTFNPLV
jgi:hypothetical protein